IPGMGGACSGVRYWTVSIRRPSGRGRRLLRKLLIKSGCCPKILLKIISALGSKNHSRSFVCLAAIFHFPFLAFLSSEGLNNLYRKSRKFPHVFNPGPFSKHLMSYVLSFFFSSILEHCVLNHVCIDIFFICG